MKEGMEKREGVRESIGHADKGVLQMRRVIVIFVSMKRAITLMITLLLAAQMATGQAVWFEGQVDKSLQKSLKKAGYTQVKDLRTEYETSDVNGVMDGNLQPFIEAWLQMKAK